MKQVLINRIGEIYIEDDNGNGVSFPSFAEFKRCSGVDFSGYLGKQITYEPYRGLHTVDDGANCVHKGLPDTTFEQMIANVGILETRKNNPLYGLTGQALEDKQAELDALDEYNAKVDAIVQEQESTGVRTYTPEQVKNYIDNQIAAAETNEEKFQTLVMLIKKLAVFVLRPDPPQ